MNTTFKPRILIVDDDDNVRTVMELIVQDGLPCAQIVGESDSHRALRSMDAAPVDLLITDCFMPKLDGPTLVRRLRQNRVAIPIIMVSGNPEAEALGRAAGADCFVPKLRMSDDLVSTIRRLTSDKGAWPVAAFQGEASEPSQPAGRPDDSVPEKSSSTAVVRLNDEADVRFWAGQLGVRPSTLEVLASVHGTSIPILRTALDSLLGKELAAAG